MELELAEKEYVNLRLARCAKDTIDIRQYAEASHTLIRRYYRTLKGAEFGLLSYLLSLTVGEGKMAEELSMRELSDGGRDEFIGKGTGLSRSTLHATIKLLAKNDWISIFRRAGGGVNDTLPRIIQPNWRLFLPRYPVQKSDTPVQKLDTPFIYIHEVPVGTNESFILSPAGAGTPTGGSEMFVGKKPKTAPAPRPEYGSAAEAIAAVTNRKASLNASRVAAATGKPAGQVTKEQLQALIAKHMKAAGFDFVMSVTNKEFGFLRKRLAENGPKDMDDFIRYVCTYWSVIAEQNAKALRKDRDRVVMNRPMPAAPDFGALSYRYPYFFKCYQNFLAERRTVEQIEQQQTQEGREVKRLQEELAAEKRNVAILRRRTPSVPTAKPEPVRPLTPARRSRMPSATTDDDLFGEATFDEWK